MTNPLLERFLARLDTEYPSHPISVRRYSRDDPTIEYFIDVLNVPIEELTRVSFRAWDLAFEVFGEQAMPFHLAALDPEQSGPYLPEALEEQRRRQGRVGA